MALGSHLQVVELLIDAQINCNYERLIDAEQCKQELEAIVRLHNTSNSIEDVIPPPPKPPVAEVPRLGGKRSVDLYCGDIPLLFRLVL